MKFSTKNGLSAKGLVPSTDARTPLEKLLDLHDELCSKGREIMQAKNADYTCGSADPYANFRISETMDIDPVVGIILRIQDKLQRIKSFSQMGELKVKGETVDDACLDIINYAVLVRGLLKERE